jgi:hypothetical protein
MITLNTMIQIAQMMKATKPTAARASLVLATA